VTRIIGGTAGGRRLRTPPGDATRPTSDRVRDALFSALEAHAGTLFGPAFLDLYAGSGAVALEAASRGARPVTAVESDRRTGRLIAANAREVGLQVSVVVEPVARALDRLEARPHDIVFADPPYPLPDAALAEALALLVVRGWLREDATVVIERSTRSVEPTWPRGLRRVRAKEYGETVLWYAAADPPGRPIGPTDRADRSG